MFSTSITPELVFTTLMLSQNLIYCSHRKQFIALLFNRDKRKPIQCRFIAKEKETFIELEGAPKYVRNLVKNLEENGSNIGVHHTIEISKPGKSYINYNTLVIFCIICIIIGIKIIKISLLLLFCILQRNIKGYFCEWRRKNQTGTHGNHKAM